MKSKYNYEYHQSLVYKIMNCRKPYKVQATFEETLEMIKKIHIMSRGLKQILYLTGWQYKGHDSKYPAWFEVNKELARNSDDDPRDSLVWLMEEAKQYNAVVSLHINMCDAYENSPMWDEYKKNDLFIREEDGSLRKGGVWDDEQAYLISQALEWKSGHAKKRIDRLLDFLPIADAQTIHIDAHHIRSSPYHGISIEDEVEGMIEIIKYWNSCGVDVTHEMFYPQFEGLIPYVYHMNIDESRRLDYPPHVVCGGGEQWNMRQVKDFRKVQYVHHATTPQAGCLYEEAWGRSQDEDAETDLKVFTEHFFLRTLPWYIMNRESILRHVITKDTYEVHLSGDMMSIVRKADRRHTLSYKGKLLVDGTDLCIPVLWKEKECMAYSLNGSEKEWELPEDMKDAGKVNVRSLLPWKGERDAALPVKDGVVRLTLEPGAAILLSVE